MTAYSDAQGHVIRAPIPPPLAESLPNPFTAFPVQGQDITLTTTGGTLNGLTTVVLATDDDGEVEATLGVPSQFTCPGTVTVTAGTSAAPCSEQYTDSNVVRVLCQQPAGVDVFFCIDWSDSMSENWPRLALEGLCSSLESALSAQSIAVRFGGLRFNDQTDINPAQVRSLSLGLKRCRFRGVPRALYDAANGYEMQWKCLHMAAQDCLSMEAAAVCHSLSWLRMRS